MTTVSRTLRVGARVAQVEIAIGSSPDSRSAQVCFDRGDPIAVELPASGAQRYQLRLRGRSLQVQVARVGRSVEVAVDGARFAVSPAANAGVSELTKPGAISAPMPGRVVEVATAVGAEVERGARLVVIEAMKMRHTLLANAAGRVQRVACAVGEQVAAGQILVELSSAEESHD